MKRLCYSSVMKIFLFLISLHLSLWAKKSHDVAFYYAKAPSETFMQHFDWIVVDPDVIHPAIMRRYQSKLFAYVSIGEIEEWRSSNTNYDRTWIIGNNKAWNSLIADYTNQEYHHFLLSKMEKMYRQGYRNFFLDTLDAPFGIVTAMEHNRYKDGLKGILMAIRNRFPEAKIIANRGFEAEGVLCQTVDAVAAESLYQGINTDNFTYKNVSQEDREWIAHHLKRYQQCGLEAIAIDYVEEKKVKLRHATAEKIEQDGFTPYVSDYKLQHEGVGKHRRISRDVLILFDGKNLKENDPRFSSAYLQLSLPIEYLGYIPHLHDVSKGLPDLNEQSFAGIIVWEGIDDEDRLYRWAQEAIERDIKLLFLNRFGFELTSERLAFLSLEAVETDSAILDGVKAIRRDPMVGFEVSPFLDNSAPLVRLKKGTSLIEALNAHGDRFTPAAVMPWGGFALNQSFLVYVDEVSHWALDPILMLQKTLGLSSFPSPSATSENGSRLWITHIDGDGMIEKTRFRRDEYAVETLYTDILKRYPVPHSVSVIVGEVSKDGVAPQISERMEEGVRKIFKLPFVEPASHSYSHPFKWKKAVSSENDGTYTLDIKGYEFSLDKELRESIQYVNTHLTAERNASTLFWTGDCNPPEEVLAQAEEAGILTLNGGDTTIQKNTPWLSYIAPMSIQHGMYRQIMAPMQNENVYTGNWTFPKWGYRRVIETMEMTDTPRRYKPINIYYHFYSASLKPSIDALKEVYEYAMKQKTLPLYASDYIRIADDFYRTDISYLDDGWLIRNHQHLRTLRIAKEQGYPDLERSKGVIGFNDHTDGRYIHLDGRGEYELYLSANHPKRAYMIESNGRIIGTSTSGVRIKSYVPLSMKWYVPNHCRLDVLPSLVSKKTGSIEQFNTDSAMEVNVAYKCR